MKALLLFTVMVLLVRPALADMADAEITINVIDDPYADVGAAIHDIKLPFPVVAGERTSSTVVSPDISNMDAVLDGPLGNGSVSEIIDPVIGPEGIDLGIPVVDDVLDETQKGIEGVIKDVLRLLPDVDSGGI